MNFEIKTNWDISQDCIIPTDESDEGFYVTAPEKVTKWVSLESLRAEMIKQYHNSEGNKHKFLKDFFQLTDEEILSASNRRGLK